MQPNDMARGLALLFTLGIVAVTLGCGTTPCEDTAIAACKKFLEETPGSGDRYNACYEKALAACENGS